MRPLAVALLLALPAVSTAQQVSQSFAYLRGTDTLGVETITLTPTTITGDLVLAGAPRVMWTHERQGTTFGALSLKVFTPGAAANSAPAQEGTVRVAGDSARLVMSAGTRSQAQTLPSARGAVALVNASVVHAALIGANASLRQGTVPLFLTSGGQSVTAAIVQRGDTLLVTINGAESRVVMAADGLPHEVTVPAQGARIVRVATAVAQATALITYDAPASAPYTAEAVTIPTGRGYELADTLARRGVATLRFDDRGVGAPGGLELARSATSANLADDVRSIIAWLKARGGIDAGNIVLAGHSEGGAIAPMVAATNAWLGFFLSYDPLVTAREVRQPVLVLQGGTDRQVSPEQADTLAAAMRTAGNRAVTMRVFPETNHLFLGDRSGAFTGYGTLKDVRVRKEVLGALAGWVVQLTTRR